MKVLKHIAAWLVLISCIIYVQKDSHPNVPFGIYFLVQSLLMLITLIIFYLNYLILVPKFLIERKIFKFLIGLFILIVLGNILSFFVKNFYDWTLGHPFFSTENISAKNITKHTMTCIFVILVSTGLRLIKQYNSDKHKRSELKKIAEKAELEALKAKINPHFLYNAFNSLYALAKIKSDKTEDAVLQLSEIMRYVTYKSSLRQVSIYEELEFIEHYIEFQKLRITHPDSKVFTNIKYPQADFLISPLLLISFVENAFKHSNLLKPDAKIEVFFEPNDNGFTYHVSNMIETNKKTESGLGLKTLKKILDFTYPDAHRINLYTEGQIHHAELILSLEND